MLALQLEVADPGMALSMTLGFAYLVIAGGAAVLLFYLYQYGSYALAAREARRNLWFFAVAMGAAISYGLIGVLALTNEQRWVELFAEGATLFFIMFLALGFRSLYLSAPDIARWHAETESGSDRFRRYFPPWLDYVIIAGYLVAWWGSFLFARQLTDLIVAAGWLLASGWAFVWAILIVQRHEGTSLAALTRHLFPAVVAFTVTIVADLVGTYVTSAGDAVVATWIVGTVLVGAFLFTTAIALRQESGEVERLYDWTTYRPREYGED